MKNTKSIIDWKETYEIFNDGLEYIVDETSDNYCLDDVINEQIKKEYLNEVFQKIDKFKFDKFHQYLVKNVETFAGEKDISIKQWSNGNNRIQLLIILDKEKSLSDSLMYTPGV